MKTYKEIETNHNKVNTLISIIQNGEHPEFFVPHNKEIKDKLDKIVFYHLERGYETLEYLQSEKLNSNRNRKRKLRSRIRNISNYIESLNTILSD